MFRENTQHHAWPRTLVGVQGPSQLPACQSARLLASEITPCMQGVTNIGVTHTGYWMVARGAHRVVKVGYRQVLMNGTACSVPDPGISPWDVLGAARVAQAAGPCSSWHPSGKQGGPSHGQMGRSSISAKAKSAQLLTNDVYWVCRE